ncbi:MAG: transcription-repair coupling factor [Desulfovibrio sp.]|nr:transcription-repair coupling factor [Desulfovibrio sp.]
MSLSSLLTSLTTGPPQTVRVNRSGPGTLANLVLPLTRAGKNVVVVVRGGAEFSECRSLLTLFSSEDSLRERKSVQAQWDQQVIAVPPYPAGNPGKGGWAERLAALYALQIRRVAQCILVSADNFLLRLPPKDLFTNHELHLYKGMDMAPDLILDQAVDWGYTRVPLVNAPGDVAMRGDILDIFCPGYSKPLRLEFFGDTLDDLRHFEPSSQRSVADVAEMRLLPVAPIIVSRQLRRKAESFWRREVAAGRLGEMEAAGFSRLADTGGLFPGTYYEDASCLEEWLPPDAVFFLPGEGDLLPVLQDAERLLAERLGEEEDNRGLRQPRARVLRAAAEVEGHLLGTRRVHWETLQIGVPENPENSIDLPERGFSSFQDLFPLPEDQERPWRRLIFLLRAWSQALSDSSRTGGFPKKDPGGADGRIPLLPRGKGRLILSFSSDRGRARFLKLAEQDGIVPQLRYSPDEAGLFALISPFRRGLFLAWNDTLILGEDVLQPRMERGERLRVKAFQGMESYDTLREGDLLVHREYGIGAFGGLQRMTLGGIENDYLLLRYAEEDKLYLPVDRLSFVQRFKGSDERSPGLDRLGGSQWSSSKEKARKAIEKIAADLVEMYALRKVVKGFRYTPVNELYREFEASFGFDETPDQARTIEEVLADMEKPEPMDRLVCGDVGFGKTEVALRAAFRAALEGRQVALLCPTTVLAEQHYQTFRSRLGAFPVNVGMLSRFVPRSKQREVLAAAAKAQIDILIGTHRLLSQDVLLPNLGLLILDEEQRFGVRHKERLKAIRKNVDVLTLTATPIPRTLQLSLSGIRELSVMETPPPDRKPVSTVLLDRNDAALRDILEREMARQGQVFWVYNRVQGLERVVEYVRALVPSARVGMAHGQMKENLLEDTMHRFWHGDLDVLVCTSIIESGLDFPRANTLVVDQAQLFGLGQLYQLRGRVGRSDRQAFAVFVTSDPERLPETVRQRLRIILDMDYLGAGFQVAMEDLRLRGAGNILGESQTGHMNRLGLDLFLEMLEEAVAKLKGKPLQIRQETELTICLPASIPEAYMADSKERLRYYKLLSSARDDQILRAVAEEMRDRFGNPPVEVENFCSVLAFKRKLCEWAVQKADVYPDKLRLSFAEESALDPARLVAFVEDLRKKGQAVRLYPPAVLEMPFAGDSVPHAFALAERQLAALLLGESAPGTEQATGRSS